MKFHRDAAPTIAPEAMAYYQTPATERSTWRADLARIGIVSGVVFVLGAFATGTSVIFWRSWETVGIGLWLTVLLALAPVLIHAWRTWNDIGARHSLDIARIYAEIDALTVFDTDADGKADTTEVDTFVEYVRRLHRNEPSTAGYAQEKMGIAGPTWTRYKNWLVRKGYAHIVPRKGGPGFRLNDSVLKTPWPKLEAQLRERVQGDLGLGLTVTDSRQFDPEAVSTLRD